MYLTLMVLLTEICIYSLGLILQVNNFSLRQNQAKTNANLPQVYKAFANVGYPVLILTCSQSPLYY
jgi:hypothetical protein